jgi:hypothetical protein
MGHRVLDELPRTPPWRRVVALLGRGLGMSGQAGVTPGSLDAVAEATIEAAVAGLQRAGRDDGLCFAFYLLTQITRAAREENFRAALVDAGLPKQVGNLKATLVNAEYSLFDLTAGFTAAVDRHLRVNVSRTDIAELAQQAAVESITVLSRESAETLFGVSSVTVQQGLRRLSTETGFGRLAKDFFARFAQRFLLYHLSRELSNHVGPGRRFANVRDHNDFLQAVKDFCQVRAAVVEKFAGEWYSKHNFEGGITPEKSEAFMPHAVEKLQLALVRGADDAT